MEYHVFKQVIQTVLTAILILLGAMVFAEIMPAVIGNKTARQAAKKIQGLEKKVANLMNEVEKSKEKIAKLTKKLEAAEEKSQAMTETLFAECEAAEKSQLEIVDLMNELDAARNFAATTLDKAFQTNQEAREKSVEILKALAERIGLFEKIAELSKSSMKQHLKQVRTYSNFGLENWGEGMKAIQECIKLDYDRIKLLDEATAVEHAMQASLDEMDEAAKKKAPSSA
ncbi:uncharacterized protein N0V96_000723 [Colletotrichum fioriniae]|uniref:uncharacterized protein n=1 Tax=Colletotrichum fioriniae TaxID=710243 RepID=UPI0032DBA587|nr:hypothetical protein N0V96_000723 [Colletotrichum fioriniae]